MTESERADYEERAAIAEYEGGLTRAEAERLARACVERARVIRRPPLVVPRRAQG